VAGWPSLSFHTTGALAPTGSPSPFCSGPYALAAFLLTLSSTIRARKQRTSSSSCLMADTYPPWGATLERSLTLHTERELESPTGGQARRARRSSARHRFPQTTRQGSIGSPA
jgi:hypothetical protein